MTTSNRLLILSAAALFTAGTLTAQTSSQSPVSVTPTASSSPAADHPWTTEQIVTCTVSECWQLSGKSEAAYFDIIQELAAMSAAKRNLVLPNDAEAGRKTGEYIKKRARADRQQLLYAVVDEAVRKVGTPAPAEATK